MLLVNNEDYQRETERERQKRENEFPLMDIQCLFSFRPLTHSGTATRERCGRQEEKERLGEQQEWHRTRECIASSPAIPSANVHLTTRSTPQTHPPPSPLTVTMATLCFPAQPLGGGLPQPIIK